MEARLTTLEHSRFHLRALLVTHDEGTGGLLARILERRGALSVQTASPAAAAAEATRAGVDVILLDLSPGIPFDAALSARLAERAPVIVLCSYLTSEERARAREAGVAAIHLKHIGVDDLRRHIDTVCNQA
ncbi:MAG: response regulator transcription factor [Chloroflexi bacterium]|nr:response regulator transcription factor [Chloroflexota bacterium]